MKIKWILKLSFLVFFADAAFGDQCYYMQKEYAEKAVSLLNQNQNIMHYCFPCDDTSPKPDSVSIAGLRLPEGDTSRLSGYRVYLESKNSRKFIDLAYVYIENGPEKNIFKNLAMLTGCPTEGVPYAIDTNGPVSLSPSFVPTPRIPNEYFVILNPSEGFVELIDLVRIIVDGFSGEIIFKDRSHIKFNEISLAGTNFSFRASGELYSYSFVGDAIKKEDKREKWYIFQGVLERKNHDSEMIDTADVTLVPGGVD